MFALRPRLSKGTWKSPAVAVDIHRDPGFVDNEDELVRANGNYSSLDEKWLSESYSLASSSEGPTYGGGSLLLLPLPSPQFQEVQGVNPYLHHLPSIVATTQAGRSRW